MDLNISSEAVIAGDKVVQDVYSDFGGVRERLLRQVLDTSEAQVRAALIKLGWTPPCGADELDEAHPLWLVNEQIKGLLDGVGASEDHEAVVSFLRGVGLPAGTASRVHEAIATWRTRSVELECEDVDRLLQKLGLVPEDCRTEGGRLMVAKVANVLLDQMSPGTGG